MLGAIAALPATYLVHETRIENTTPRWPPSSPALAARVRRSTSRCATSTRSTPRTTASTSRSPSTVLVSRRSRAGASSQCSTTRERKRVPRARLAPRPGALPHGGPRLRALQGGASPERDLRDGARGRAHHAGRLDLPPGVPRHGPCGRARVPRRALGDPSRAGRSGRVERRLRAARVRHPLLHGARRRRHHGRTARSARLRRRSAERSRPARKRSTAPSARRRSGRPTKTSQAPTSCSRGPARFPRTWRATSFGTFERRAVGATSVGTRDSSRRP